MSKRLKLSRFPATVVGLVIGLTVGLIAAIKEVYEQQHPKIGIAIIIITPLLVFIFEEIMRVAFPQAYLERVAGYIFWFIRLITNESFRLRFRYVLRFPILPQPTAISSDEICVALKAEPGGDPEPSYIGENFVHLRFSSVPFSIVLNWSVEVSDIDTVAEEQSETVFVVTMEPETRDFVLRNAPDDVEALLVRLQQIQQQLINYFKGSQPTTLAIADAWLGTTIPPATPIPRSRRDRITGAEYRLYPGLLHISGNNTATLGAVCRYVSILEPPPDEQD